jgi:penicillin-binding protein 1A
LPQAALLMGQINAPTAYSPLRHRDRATLRLNTCSIARALEAGAISPFSAFFLRVTQLARQWQKMAPAQLRQAIARDLAAQIVHLLQQAVDRGTGRRIRHLGFKRPAAGKTGTNNNNTVAWFAGFTPEIVASVWVGFDDHRGHPSDNYNN